MKKKMNNKGFSLVELIVVMAIMAILAVTLAPKLTQYVEKARKAADQEVINSVYTAVEYGILDSKISEDAKNLTGLTTGFHLNSLDDEIAASEVYQVNATGTWNTNDTGGSQYTNASNKLIKEIYTVVDDFKFKSDDADANTDIVLTVSGSSIKVELQYSRGTTDYTVDSAEVR